LIAFLGYASQKHHALACGYTHANQLDDFTWRERKVISAEIGVGAKMYIDDARRGLDRDVRAERWHL
jgi:hypothetical protein